MIPTIKDILTGFQEGRYSLESCLVWMDQHVELGLEIEFQQDRRRRVFEQVALAYVTGDTGYAHDYFTGRQLPVITRVAELILSESEAFSKKENK